MARLPLRLDLAFALCVVLTQRLEIHDNVTAQHNVSPPTGHVGGNRDRCRFTGLRNNLCLTLMLFCVQHFVADFLFSEQSRQIF